MSREQNPEIGQEIVAAGYRTNLHDRGQGEPLMLVHGSGPGVTAWANWRGAIPSLSETFRVVAPDMLGFGYSERPDDAEYNLDRWVDHAVGVLDALDLQHVNLVGNSFGGAVALALAIRHPERVRRLVLMGSVGVPFPISEGLDAVWGYTPSFENMRRLVKLFAYNQELVTDELAELRYQASIRPGFQESFAAMFPAPRQRWVDAMASPEEAIRALPHETLILHGREDRVIPLDTSLTLMQWIPKAQLHVFGHCGHWTQIEHAQRFIRLVRDFVLEGRNTAG
ncbi:MAG: alpha/beta fold hydrolase [Ectothiorhodospiraceae bacterium]|nr:alpha/beta fold hydrolase [Ectothiorhodospiraceae bacterium]